MVGEGLPLGFGHLCGVNVSQRVGGGLDVSRAEGLTDRLGRGVLAEALPRVLQSLGLRLRVGVGELLELLLSLREDLDSLLLREVAFLQLLLRVGERLGQLFFLRVRQIGVGFNLLLNGFELFNLLDNGLLDGLLLREDGLLRIGQVQREAERKPENEEQPQVAAVNAEGQRPSRVSAPRGPRRIRPLVTQQPIGRGRSRGGEFQRGRRSFFQIKEPVKVTCRGEAGTRPEVGEGEGERKAGERGNRREADERRKGEQGAQTGDEREAEADGEARREAAQRPDERVVEAEADEPAVQMFVEFAEGRGVHRVKTQAVRLAFRAADGEDTGENQ